MWIKRTYGRSPGGEGEGGVVGEKKWKEGASSGRLQPVWLHSRPVCHTGAKLSLHYARIKSVLFFLFNVQKPSRAGYNLL